MHGSKPFYADGYMQGKTFFFHTSPRGLLCQIWMRSKTVIYPMLQLTIISSGKGCAVGTAVSCSCLLGKRSIAVHVGKPSECFISPFSLFSLLAAVHRSSSNFACERQIGGKKQTVEAD